MKNIRVWTICAVSLFLSSGVWAQKVKFLPPLTARTAKSPITNQVQRALLRRSVVPTVQLANRPSVSHLSPAFLAQSALPQDKHTKILQAARPGVFHAPTEDPVHHNFFSGGIFKVETDGKTEIFGAIATHALPYSFQYGASLQRYFNAIVDTEQGPMVVQAEVVQISAQESLDVALVKFRPEDEPYLHPLTLASHNPQRGEKLYAQGVARQEAVQTTLYMEGYTSIGAGKTSLTADFCSANRAGFCGSPAVDKQGHLAGIFIGRSPKEFTGYIAPANTLRLLVQAYHHPQSTMWELKLAGKHLAYLPVDQNVDKLEFLDENKHFLWSALMSHKVSMSEPAQMLFELPRVRYVRLRLRWTHWEQDEHGWYLIIGRPDPDELVIPFQIER